MGASSYLKNKVLDHVLGGPSFTAPTPYCALFTADPGDTGANEATYSGYTRVNAASSFGAAASGLKSNNAVITFPVNGGGSSTSVTHFGFFDAASGGNFLGGAPLDSKPVSIPAGNSPQFSVAKLKARLL